MADPRLNEPVKNDGERGSNMTTTKVARKPATTRVSKKGQPEHCPGCGKKTPVNSGPLSRGNSPDGVTTHGEPGAGQSTTFCSYRCWVKHRKATGQDE